jgi:hypothetical protein
MQRKRYTNPEQLLQRVVLRLEDEGERGHREALQALLAEGPLLCSDALLTTLQKRDVAPWAEIRVEVLAFLRTLIREAQYGRPSSELGIYGSVTFTGLGGSGRTVRAAEGSVRDLLVLQLVMLLHEVGIGQVRTCAAFDCQRLFVKTYRRNFCSTRCQKRTHTAAMRRAQLEEERRAGIRARRNRRAR